MYTCPMHPEIISDKPGKCSKCGMDLVLKSEVAKIKPPKRSIKDFLPLIIIFSLIFIFTIYKYYQHGDAQKMMMDFMGAFFVTFSVLKLLNWKGFAEAYATYDIIAKRFKSYGYIYPLIELILGYFYLTYQASVSVLLATIILMSISALGVYKELRKGNQIMCACLGVVFKIPMTWVTFLEYAVMAVMALIILGLTF